MGARHKQSGMDDHHARRAEGEEQNAPGTAANDAGATLTSAILLRFHPGIRARYLDGNIGKEYVQWLAIGSAAVLG